MVLNLGSTSFKFKLFEMDGHEKLLAQGSIDAIGSGTSALVVKIGEDKTQKTVDCPNHDQAFRLCMNELKSILPDLKALSAIGYKAVLAGEISGAQPITPEFLQKMEALVPLAPAHNPVYIDVMGSMLKSVPEVQQFACFETAFHATVPKRAVYGVPQKWREWGIRRYRFHGASHSFIASETARLWPDARRVISVHLGGSCSICAIQDGRSVATSMGATPQSGLFHNNRVGDFDPFCFPLLEEKLGGTKQILQALSKESGLLGLSGVSNDLRKVEGRPPKREMRRRRLPLTLSATISPVISKCSRPIWAVWTPSFSQAESANTAPSSEGKLLNRSVSWTLPSARRPIRPMLRRSAFLKAKCVCW